MKKVLIVGADIPMGAQIAKSMKEREIVIVEKQNPFESEPILIRNIYPILNDKLDTNFLNIYEKPKSKFHK